MLLRSKPPALKLVWNPADAPNKYHELIDLMSQYELDHTLNAPKTNNDKLDKIQRNFISHQQIDTHV